MVIIVGYFTDFSVKANITDTGLFSLDGAI